MLKNWKNKTNKTVKAYETRLTIGYVKQLLLHLSCSNFDMIYCTDVLETWHKNIATICVEIPRS